MAESAEASQRHDGHAGDLSTPRGVPCDPEDSRNTELVDLLVTRGATREQIEAAAQLGLSGLAADLVLSASQDTSAEELADKAGVDLEDVAKIWRALGVDVSNPKEPIFSAADVELTRGLAASDIWSHGDADELLRVVGSALARVADAAVAFYVQTVESDLEASGATPAQFAEESAVAAAKVLELGNSLGAVFAHHMRAAVVRQRLAQANVSDRAVFRVVIGFVDLVGFTPLSRRLSSHELSAFVSQFESKAFRIANEHGGQIVKHIGDEVMFAALDPVAGCELALALIQEFSDERIQPRGGLAFGEVVTRQGDYYGEVVNLASRLTELAIPGEVLADTGVRDAAHDASLVFEAAGRRQLKGFDDPVPVYSVSTTDLALA